MLVRTRRNVVSQQPVVLGSQLQHVRDGRRSKQEGKDETPSGFSAVEGSISFSDEAHGFATLNKPLCEYANFVITIYFFDQRCFHS